MDAGAIDVLVVDRDPGRRRKLRRVLKRCDRSPIAVGSAHELVAVLQQFEVRCLLVGDSGDAQAHARALEILGERTIPILVLTDTGAPRRVAAYLRLGPHVRVVEPTAASIGAELRGESSRVPKSAAYRQVSLGPLPGALGDAIISRRTLSV